MSPKWNICEKRRFINVLIGYALVNMVWLIVYINNQVPSNGSLTELQDEKDIPHNNVFFLKLHKTASSTLQNILFRYADTNNLAIALPQLGGTTFNYPWMFSPGFVQPFGKPFNMMCHHLRYDKSVYRVMPPDTKSITVIRHPDTQFISAFNYFDFANCFKHFGIKTIEDFVKVLRKINNEGACWPINPQNSMLYDFGVPFDKINNMTIIADKIQEIAKTFDLVMLNEYFDEGLILMRDLLGWTSNDIIYINKLVSSTPKEKISTKTRDILREYNKEDVLLYNHFNKTFWKKAENYGLEKLKMEVDKFRELNQKWYNFCIEAALPGDQIKDTNFMADYKDDMVLGYDLNKDAEDTMMCYQLATQEVQYTQYFNLKQRE